MGQGRMPSAPPPQVEAETAPHSGGSILDAGATLRPDAEKGARAAANPDELALRLSLVRQLLGQEMRQLLFGQEMRELVRAETQAACGACWHPSAKQAPAGANAPAGQRAEEADAAAWEDQASSVVQSSGLRSFPVGEELRVPQGDSGSLCEVEAMDTIHSGCVPSRLELRCSLDDHPEDEDRQPGIAEETGNSIRRMSTDVLSMTSGDRTISLVRKATQMDVQPVSSETRMTRRVSQALSQVVHPESCWLESLDTLWDMLGRVEAPPRPGWLQSVVRSNVFNFIIYAVILTNCFLMIYSVDYEVSSGGGIPRWVVSAEIFFLAFYAIEFLIKVCHFRSYYFIDVNWKLNVLDLFLLISTLWNVVDVIGSDMNISWLRTVRLLRLARVLRLVRVFSLVKPLRDIVRGLQSTMSVLFWSMVMLCCILLMFSMGFVQRMATFLEEQGDDVDPTLKAEILVLFPSVHRSMITLFMATSAGEDWVVHYRVMAQTGSFNSHAYIFYVAFIQIAVMNIILGIFVDRAMKNLSSESADALREHIKEEKHHENELKALCNAVDLDKSGSICQDDWDNVGQKKLNSYLHMMGLKPSDVQEFFRMMSTASPDGMVNVEEFVRGCMRLKGNASCFDMQKVSFQLQALREGVRRNNRQVKKMAESESRDPMGWQSENNDDGRSSVGMSPWFKGSRARRGGQAPPPEPRTATSL